MTRNRGLLLVAMVVMGVALAFALWPASHDEASPVVSQAEPLPAVSPLPAGDEVPVTRAGAASDAGEEEDGEEEASVMLTVRVERDGQPVAGAEVALVEPGAPPVFDETVTGADGEVRVDTLVGEVAVHARNAGLIGVERVALYEGEPSNVVVKLTGAAELTGVVREAGGGPIAGAQVVVNNALMVETGAGGDFRLTVPAGDVHVAAHHDDYSSQSRNLRATQGQVARADFELSRTFSLELAATCDGQPVSRFACEFQRDGGPPLMWLETTDVRLERGTYAVTARLLMRDGGLCVGETHVEIDRQRRLEVAMQSQELAPFIGRRRADGGHTPAAWLNVLTHPVVNSERRPGTTLVRATRGAEHQDSSVLPARLELAPGTWHVKVLTPLGSGEETVELDDGERSEVTIELKPGGVTVTGRLTEIRTGAPPKQLVDAHVSAYYSPAADPYFIKAELTSDGRFKFTGLPAEPCVLLVQAKGYARMLRPLLLTGNLELGSIDLTPGTEGLLSAEALGITWSLVAGLPRVDTSNGSSPLQVGDVLLAVQGIALEGLSLRDIRYSSAGPMNLPVPVSIRRQGAVLTVQLPRSAQ